MTFLILTVLCAAVIGGSVAALHIAIVVYREGRGAVRRYRVRQEIDEMLREEFTELR